MTHPLEAARAFIAKERDSFIHAQTTNIGGEPDLSTLDDDARAMLDEEFNPALQAVEAAMAPPPKPAPDVHLMIDTETFGGGGGGGLVQLGVCAFTLESPKAHLLPTAEWTINLQSSLLLGGEVDVGTIGFWRKQSQLARDAISGPAVPVEVALYGLVDFWKAHGCRYPWSHGATFDLPILSGYFARAGIKAPWSYSACRDTRTLFDMAERLTDWRRDATKAIAHTAAADAVAQACDVQAAWAALSGRPALSQNQPET